MKTLDHVTAGTFDREVLKSDLPVLVEFYTTWCPGCRAVEPVLESLAGEFEGKARIVKVNVEEEPLLAGEYQISAVPTLAFFRDGELRGGFQGGRPAPVLRDALSELVGKAA
jgi:thioredoxin 1